MTVKQRKYEKYIKIFFVGLIILGIIFIGAMVFSIYTVKKFSNDITMIETYKWQ